MKNNFVEGEIIKIKRTSGVWENGEIVEVYPFGVKVKVRITDNFRGKSYSGPHKDGYKFIKNEKFEDYLKKKE